MGTKGIIFSGQVFHIRMGRVEVTGMIPYFRIGNCGVALQLDSAFEISRPLGGVYTIIDVLLLGFGVSITIEPKGEQSC